MKKPIHLSIPVQVLFMVLFITSAAASTCTEAMIKAMKDEGLSSSQIQRICEKAELYARKTSSVFTPEKIEKDLVGRTMGPQAGVMVKTRPGGPSGPGTKSRSATPGGRSYDAMVSVPWG
jgi:hypothetical protein